MKLIAKTLLALLLTAALAFQVFTAVPASASDKDLAFKAYYDLIEELHKSDELSDGFDRYALIYVDNDSVPELLAVDTPSDEYDNNGTYQYELYTFFDGKAVKLGNYASGVASAGGYRGNTFYVKKSGRIYETSSAAASGDGKDVIYSMQNGEMTETARGEFNIGEDDAVWNGKTLSGAKYSKKLNKVFKTKKAVSFENVKTVSYKKMRKKLK